MVYKSKIAWWFYAIVILLGILTAVLLYCAVAEHQIILYIAAVIFTLLMGLMMVPMLLNTKYVLDKKQLCIVCGLTTQRIPYGNILSVKPNFDPSSSPALSLDRVQIRYSNKNGNNNFVSISPKAKDQFIEELMQHIERI